MLFPSYHRAHNFNHDFTTYYIFTETITKNLDLVDTNLKN